MSNSKTFTLNADQSQGLLELFSTWDNTTTIILHGGSVFEFKGVFPSGNNAHGFYNLKGETGFEGHLNLSKVATITAEIKQHRGREARSFNFIDGHEQLIFKVFLGRDDAGEIHINQIAAFDHLTNHAHEVIR